MSEIPNIPELPNTPPATPPNTPTTTNISKQNMEITQELYDNILDILDNQNTQSLYELFTSYNLTYNSKLYDAPRDGFNDNALETYIDYVLAFNLSNVLNFLIDDINLEITDTLIARCIELGNIDTYNYILLLGYSPQIKTFKCAVHNCYSYIIEQILKTNIEFIHELTDFDINSIFNYNIDGDTVETIYTLFNHGANPNLFIYYSQSLQDPDNQVIPIGKDEQEFVMEIIDIFKCNSVI